MTSTQMTFGLSENRRLSSKVLNPPGGASSVVFGEDGSPAENNQNNNSTPNNLKSTALSGNGHSNGVESNGRRKSDCTQDRLFGPAEEYATPRKIVDRMKSRIFEDEVDSTSKTTPGGTKRYVSRNPITGDVTEKSLNTPGQNGHTNGQESSPMNGTPSPGQTNQRVRNPPGGRSSGIF